ncbi:glycosyltransferase family 4 protein [Litoribacter alkaliphilus]|uniref:Glycosyltransferase family 4 protein n=1 Tax=Litoribacter ruber TaxID=702568 RepID=A0AAP2CHJ9_9BACT|nr:glycosyltransferase family 4 protein [Litoribacter alkaliphilus]MBS9524838.1 glycosyltransferase family 4 protein [Litoribacter alkaliphilus]
MPKLIRITTVPMSLKLLLTGQMKFLKENGWEVKMVSAEGREIQDAKKNEGVEHISIPFTRQITPFHDLYCLWLLIQLFRKEKPDIVHTHTPKAGLLGMLAAWITGVKVRIHTVAGMPYMVAHKNKAKLLIWCEKLTFKLAHQVWPNSKSLKDFILKEELVDPAKIKVIGEGSSNGVNLNRFNRNSLKENHLVAAMMRVVPGDNEFVILAVGRMVRDKGIEDLVKAFLDSKIVNKSKLVLLGPMEQELNPLDDEIVRKIADHPKIVHIDWSDHVEHYMAISDILVHASHREGCPNVILQAGAMQCPVICSDIIGNIDIITHKKTGLVYPVKKAQVLKEALEFAYVKREVMYGFAQNLYEEVKTKFDSRVMHQLILEEYQQLLNKE